MLAKPCGHVICKACVQKFMLQQDHDAHAVHDGYDNMGLTCFVCDQSLEANQKNSKGKGDDEKKSRGGKDKIEPGLVEIRSEGTGFASGGASKVEKTAVAFQC